MGILQTLFHRTEQEFLLFCNRFFSPSYLPQNSKWRADSKKFNRNKKLKKRQRNWQKLAGQTRRRPHKLPLRGNALCVSLKCRTRKPTSSISKASIQKHQCLRN